MYYVYIIQSEKNGRYYTPWRLLCYKIFTNQGEAYEEEQKVKSYKGGNAFKKVILGEVAEWFKATVC